MVTFKYELQPSTVAVERLLKKGYQGRSPQNEYFFGGDSANNFHLMGEQGRYQPQNRNFSALNLSPVERRNIIDQSYIRNNLPVPNRGYSALGQQMNAMNLPMPSGSGQKKVSNNTPPNQKNNLLNYLVSPKGKGMAQGLLEASGYSDVPITAGQALAMGMKRSNESQAAADASVAAQQKSYMDNLLIQSQIYKNYAPSGNPKDQYRPMTDEEYELYKIPKDMPMRYNITQNKPEVLSAGGNNVTINPNDKNTNAGFLKLEEGSADILTDLSKSYKTGFDQSNDTLSQLSTLKRTLMPLDEKDFGRLSPTKIAFAQFLSGMGFPIDTNDTALMESVFAQGGAFVMGQIQLTKGAVSEKEMAYFDMISPSLTKTKEGMLLMISILEHGQKHKQKIFNKYTNFKKTWKQREKEGASPVDLETEWNEMLIKIESESTAPDAILKQIDNIVYKQAKNDLAEGVTIKLDPQKNAETINKEFLKDDGTDRFLSKQFIGFDPQGYPIYMVEDGENNFRKLRVFPDGE